MFFLNNLDESNKSALVGIAIVGILFFIVCSLFPGGYKPDPDEKGQREIAKKILRGQTTAEDVAAKEGYDPEHIEGWIKNYKDLAVKYALDSDKYAEQVILLEQDIVWFTKTCEKYIGADWREKTGFGDHNLDKYK